MYSKKHPEEFEYVVTKHLDLIKTFEPSVRDAWNFHSKRLEDSYNDILAKVQKQRVSEVERNTKFRRLCDDGNVFIPINEMTADYVVGKLVIVEEDADKIWQAL